MKYRHTTILAACLTVYLASPALAETARLVVTPDRREALYALGEPITFTITADLPGNAAPPQALACRVTDGYGGVLFEATSPVDARPWIVTVTPERAGVVRCHVTAPGLAGDDGKPLSATHGVGVALETIQPGRSQEPADFEAFWKTMTEELDARPLQVDEERVAGDEAAGTIAFDVTIDCPGPRPARGYLALPANAAPRSLPAILLLHGAGVRSSSLSNAVNHAQRGVLAMDLNAHGILNGQDEAYYDQLNTGELATYRTQGQNAPRTFYFYAMYQRFYRAMQYLRSRPEWDGRTLIVQGSSQGGSQAIAAAALEPAVSLLVVSKPAMCDHFAGDAGRRAGWPQLIERVTTRMREGEATETDTLAVAQTAGYFDSAYFARRVRCPAYFVVGFLDDVCPTETVYAAFNQITTDKHMFHEPTGLHTSVNTPGSRHLAEVVARFVEDRRR